MSTPPGQLPPPPPPAGTTATRSVGQESAPATSVPIAPAGGLYASAAAGQYNSTAIISLVAGAVAFLGHIPLPGIGGGTIALVAIVTGFIARAQIKHTGEQGTWMANTGIVLGFVHLALLGLFILLIIFVVFVLGIAWLGFSAHR